MNHAYALNVNVRTQLKVIVRADIKDVERSHTPIIFVTAVDPEPSQISWAYKNGAVDFIRKPFDLDILRSKATVFVSLYQAKEQSRRHEAVLRERERSDLLARERAARAEAEDLAARLQVADHLKDEFLATLSHELRTPLNAILGWTRMLRAGSVREEQRERALETVERNAEAQLRLIEEMLDISRIISGKMDLKLGAVDLADVIDLVIQTVRPAALAKGVRLDSALDRGLGLLRGDQDCLGRVVWNLLNNAVKFTPARGVVTVTLRRDGACVEFAVEDSGEGIDSRFLPHVFERFRQADGGTTRVNGGLGLGLAIVKHLVELHGGSVQARSDGTGKGARFVVRLPVTPATIPPAPPPAAFQPDLAGMRVLVVDDEEDARVLLTTILEHCNAEVIAAASAADAVSAFDSMRPHAVVTDIAMPAEDGFELVRRIRERGAADGGGTPVIAFTACTGKEHRRRAFLTGFDAFMHKPVEEAEFLAVLVTIWRRIRPTP